MSRKQSVLIWLWLFFLIMVSVIPLVRKLRTLPEDREEYLRLLGQVPVLQDGRLRTIEGVARRSLLVMREKQKIRFEGHDIAPLEFMLKVIFDPVDAARIPVFLVRHPEVISFLGKEGLSDNLFTYGELADQREKIMREAESILAIDEKYRSLFQKNLLRLVDKMTLYEGIRFSIWMPFYEEGSKSISEELDMYLSLRDQAVQSFHEEGSGKSMTPEEKHRLWNMIHLFRSMDTVSSFRLFAPETNLSDLAAWQTSGDYFFNVVRSRDRLKWPVFGFFNSWVHGHSSKTYDVLINSISAYLEFVKHNSPAHSRLHAEYILLNWQPFYLSLVLYVVTFVVILFVWLSGRMNPGRLFALCPFYVAVGVHLCGLLLRMYVHGRPPVTNLYSSAVFVGLAAMVLSMIVERIHRNGMGLAASSLIGFVTLVIAHQLSVTSDTFEAVRAVLDSNFWLSTHVVTITLGYSGMFLAGSLAIVYILGGVFSRKMNESLRQSIGEMVYALTAFNLIFTFVGTVLGGIWADQSWGRFWGWDPKENGALLIVMWNVIVLHSLKIGWIRETGLMVMAIGGNMITSFSWFGVNLLGVGLHSYGFMEKGWISLWIFICSQSLILGLGLLPRQWWRSHQ